MNAARRFARRGAWTRNCLRAIGAAALLLCALDVARAQDVEPLVPHRWDIKAGVFFPTQGTLHRQAGTPYYVIAADYFPQFRYRPLHADVALGVDLMWRSKGNLSFLTVPLTAKLLWTISPSDWPVRVYGGLGPGVYFINTGFIGETTQAGLKFVAGVDLTQRWFLEANYDWVGGFTDDLGNGVRVDGLTFTAGFRF